MCNIKVNCKIVLTNFTPFLCFSFVSRTAGTGFKPFVTGVVVGGIAGEFSGGKFTIGACIKYTKAENSIKLSWAKDD